jgi:methylated-DNA-[protein]-cysteine S-methyltransferase
VRPSPEQLFIDRLPSPSGTIVAVFDEDLRLRTLDWTDYEDRRHRLMERYYGPEGQGYSIRQRALPNAIRDPLNAYFAGQLCALDGIAVYTGGTDFQREVWRALRTIPAGHTLSYSGLAEKLGRPKAVRAVGLANGANPIAIVVPCHRVIGANGSLTGYGGGLARKQWLLAHEGVLLNL